MLKSWQPENISNLLEGRDTYLTALHILNTFKKSPVTPTWPPVRGKHRSTEHCIWDDLVGIVLDTAKENGRPWSTLRREKSCEIPSW